MSDTYTLIQFEYVGGDGATAQAVGSRTGAAHVGKRVNLGA